MTSSFIETSVISVGNGGARSLHYTIASETAKLLRQNSIRQLTQQNKPTHLNDDAISRSRTRYSVDAAEQFRQPENDGKKKVVNKRAVPRTSSAITTAIPPEYITVVVIYYLYISEFYYYYYY